MKEFRIKNAIVRVHGNPSQDNLKAATEKFMKKVLQNRKKKG